MDWCFLFLLFSSPDVREFLSLDNPKNAEVNDEDPGTDDVGEVSTTVSQLHLSLKIFIWMSQNKISYVYF